MKYLQKKVLFNYIFASTTFGSEGVTQNGFQNDLNADCLQRFKILTEK